MDYENEVKEITLQSGEMLLIEGANVLHSRPKPLKGEFCDIAYIHFTLEGKAFKELNDIQISILDMLDKNNHDMNSQFEESVPINAAALFEDL